MFCMVTCYLLPWIASTESQTFLLHQSESYNKILNEKADQIPNFRMMHDQSLPDPSGLSVNTRVIEEELPPCMFGFCLLRILHYKNDTCQ